MGRAEVCLVSGQFSRLFVFGSVAVMSDGVDLCPTSLGPSCPTILLVLDGFVLAYHSDYLNRGRFTWLQPRIWPLNFLALYLDDFR